MNKEPEPTSQTLALYRWATSNGPSESGADGEPDIVLPVREQVRKKVGVHPVGGEAQADQPRYVEVEATAQSKEQLSISLVSTRQRGPSRVNSPPN